MIWDGGVQKTWTKMGQATVTKADGEGVNGYVQYGWRIIDTKLLGSIASRRIFS